VKYVLFATALVTGVGCNLILDQHPGVTCTCAPEHGTGKCVDGACVITACDFAFEDVDHDSSNGCETQSPLAVDSLALWLRADQGVTVANGSVVGWENQAPPGGVTSVTMGAPTLDDTGAWPDVDLPSVRFRGSDLMGVDLSAMMSAPGYTTFVAVARYGDGPYNCVLGSPTYPPATGWSCGGTPNAAGTAFQLGWTSNTRAFSEPFCSATSITTTANDATSFQPVVMTAWFDPGAPAHYFSLDGTTVSTQVYAHALVGLSSPSMLGGCPSGPRLDGLVGEVIVYSTLLSNDDRDLVHAYLKARWKTH